MFNNISKLLLRSLIFIVLFCALFSDWPLINNFPSKVELAWADSTTYTISDGSLTATLTSGACDTSQTNSSSTTDGAQGTVVSSACVGRNDMPVIKWNKTLTWEAMGIPAGSTVTQVNGSFKYRVVSETYAATQAMGSMQLRDSSDGSECAASALEASFDPGAVSSSYTSRDATAAVNVSAGCQASNTSVTIRLNMSPVTGNNGSATSELRADDVQLSITYTPPSPNLTQIHYRWRNDDNNEANATWYKAADTAMNRSPNITMRLRLEVSNEGAATASGTTYRLEYGTLSSTCSAIALWTAVPVTATTEAFDIQDSSNLTDGNATTDVAGGLNNENTTFVAGQVKDTGNETSGISLTTSEFTELEYALQANSNATAGNTYCFRVTNAGSTSTFSYSVYPEWTVGQAVMKQKHVRWRNDNGVEGSSTSTITLHPTSQGNYNSWGTTDTASGCVNDSAEWECVNDNNTSSGSANGNDGTSTDLSTTSAGARSSFNLGDGLLPSDASVTQIEIFILGAEVAAAGPNATVTPFYRYNSADTDCGSASSFGGTSYTTSSCVFTPTSWGPTEINGMEIGILFGSQDPTVTKVYVTVSYTQTAATWKQNEDQAHSNQSTGQNLRLRLGVANTGEISGTSTLRLDFAERTGGTCGDETFGAVAVASGGEFEMTTSTYVADGDSTTAQLTAVGTFTAGKVVEDPSNSSGSVTINAAYYTEVEYVIQAAASAAGKTYCFRVSNSGTALDAYDAYAVISIAGGGGTLTVDIVDSGGSSVGSPSLTFDNVTFSFAYQTATGTFGIASQKIRVNNTTAGPQWNLTVAATSGSTAVWDAGTPEYDYNDPTAGAADGSDTPDTVGGQMTLNASGATIAPQGGCNTTGLALGSTNSFSEGVTSTITLLTADATAGTNCYWDLTSVTVTQTIPAEQAVGSYALDMTLTVTAI